MIAGITPQELPSCRKHFRPPLLTAACLGFLALVTIAVFWRHLFAGFTFPFDYIATSRWPVFLTNNVRGGFYSEWIPFVGGGMALPYNAASGLYFPPWLVMGWLGVPATVTAQSAVMAGHIFLGAAGVFLLSRSMGLDRRWALLAGTAFLLFGGHYSNGYLDMIMRGHTYAPWLLFALTPPRENEAERGWRRVLSLPFWVWILAAGSYPGQAMAFLQVAAVYTAVHLWIGRARLRRLLPYLVPAVVAALAVFVALYLPSLLAARAGELHRPFPASAHWRAIFALSPVDFFGLWLNPFAWNDIPSIITGWSVGTVVLIGLTGVSRADLRRHLALAVAGGVAFLLAFLPWWGPAGRLMERLPLLFPSRLPASDSKAMIAVALVCLSGVGWSRIAAGRGGRVRFAALALGLVLIAGVALAPSHNFPAAALPWLLALIVAAAVALVFVRSRLNSRALFAILLVLTLAEGSRLIFEMEVFPGESSWALPPQDFPERALHDTQARTLYRQLAHPPERRPARILEHDMKLTIEAHGFVADAFGYLGTDYHLGDYASAISMARRKITLNPHLREIMLEPWTAWVWPCDELDCTGQVIEIPEFAGRESDQVRTTSYGLDEIRYQVDLQERSLMVENETFARGWEADRADIVAVSIDDTLRGWVMPAGRYTFTATYVLPERRAQIALAALALVAWGAAVLLHLLRGRRLPGGAAGTEDSA